VLLKVEEKLIPCCSLSICFEARKAIKTLLKLAPVDGNGLIFGLPELEIPEIVVRHLIFYQINHLSCIILYCTFFCETLSVITSFDRFMIEHK
jgi:hypothetical protein